MPEAKPKTVKFVSVSHSDSIVWAVDTLGRLWNFKPAENGWWRWEFIGAPTEDEAVPKHPDPDPK